MAGRAAHCAPPLQAPGLGTRRSPLSQFLPARLPAAPQLRWNLVPGGGVRPGSSLGVRGGHGHGHPGQARLQQPHGRRRSSARPVAPAEPLAGPLSWFFGAWLGEEEAEQEGSGEGGQRGAGSHRLPHKQAGVGADGAPGERWLRAVS